MCKCFDEILECVIYSKIESHEGVLVKIHQDVN